MREWVVGGGKWETGEGMGVGEDRCLLYIQTIPTHPHPPPHLYCIVWEGDGHGQRDRQAGRQTGT